MAISSIPIARGEGSPANLLLHVKLIKVFCRAVVLALRVGFQTTEKWNQFHLSPDHGMSICIQSVTIVPYRKLPT